MTSDDSTRRRRTFCKACIGCLTAGSVGAVGYPVVSFMGLPQRQSTEKPFEVALAHLPAGQAEYGRFHGGPIVAVNTESGPEVLSATCTHLGCTVIWDAADAVFRCPCHGAIFSSDGHVVSGPVNVPLKVIPFKIEDGRIIVSGSSA